MSRPFIIVFFLSLVLILGRGFVWPKYQELKFLEQRNEEKRVEIEGRKEYLQDLNKAAKVLKNYQNQLTKIDSALPSDSHLVVLLNFLQKATSQSGLVLKDIQPSTSRPSLDVEGIKENELSLVVAGTYTSFKNFLSTLEMSSRLIEVESISFSSSKEDIQDFNLKIKVYSY
ncbi:MAG: type 4a pilus biogenesis protein PilO [Patescibacteria group bacterium]|nr:type 4a pilus biogenesis protein PilO [Patescibacteria group bacterium]